MTRSARLRRPLATLFAAAAAWLALVTLRPGPPPAVRVLAAARDLPAGATLAPSDVRPVSLPPEAVPSGALRADAAGRVLAGPMRRGEPLTDVRVIGDRLLRGYGPDKVATPIRVADADTTRLVRPGDRIDVLAAPPTTTHGEAPMTTPLTDTRPSPPRREQEPLQSANGNRGTSRPASPWPRTSEALPQRRTNGAHDSPVLEPMSRTRPTAPADCEPGERPATPPPRSTPVPARPSTTRATTWTTTQATSGAGRRAHPSTATQATTLTTTWTGASAGVRGHASTARATAWTSTWTGASVGRRAHASTARPTAWTSTWTTTWTSSGVGRRAAARAGGTPGDGARVVVSSVPVIAVPSSEEERTRDGALLVLATSRTQALALAGSRTDLSVTITAP